MRFDHSPAARRCHSAARRPLIVTSAILLQLILLSCPSPIPQYLASQIDDAAGPVITISEPADRSLYSTVVRASGTIVDRDGEDLSPTAGRISECWFSVAGTQIAGTFAPDEDGGFSFLFATREPDGSRLVSGPATLLVSAKDWNGNVSTASVQLLPVEPDSRYPRRTAR